jgi:hypothetical protein
MHPYSRAGPIRRALCAAPTCPQVRVNAIGGGSEEIMLELWTKTARL